MSVIEPSQKEARECEKYTQEHWRDCIHCDALRQARKTERSHLGGAYRRPRRVDSAYAATRRRGSKRRLVETHFRRAAAAAFARSISPASRAERPHLRLMSPRVRARACWHIQNQKRLRGHGPRNARACSCAVKQAGNIAPRPYDQRLQWLACIRRCESRELEHERQAFIHQQRLGDVLNANPAVMQVLADAPSLCARSWACTHSASGVRTPAPGAALIHPHLRPHLLHALPAAAARGRRPPRRVSTQPPPPSPTKCTATR